MLEGHDHRLPSKDQSSVITACGMLHHSSNSQFMHLVIPYLTYTIKILPSWIPPFHKIRTINSVLLAIMNKLGKIFTILLTRYMYCCPSAWWALTTNVIVSGWGSSTQGIQASCEDKFCNCQSLLCLSTLTTVQTLSSLSIWYFLHTCIFETHENHLHLLYQCQCSKLLQDSFST